MRLDRRLHIDVLGPAPIRATTDRYRLLARGAAALLAVWLALAAPSAAAERQIVESRAADGSGVVLIAGDEESWVLEGGTLERLELPPGAWLNRIETTERGWAAGGARATGEGQDLFLLVHDGEATVELELPFARSGAIRQSVVPLVRTGRLAGVAWLEGDGLDALAVRAASLDAGRWGPAETVSPPALGGQVALSGAVLADGRPLLVWSRYDGEDTETVWSQRSADGEWTPVRSIHERNAVPDLTPALIATPRGALAAWSFYDGDTMRLRLSRFDGGEWTDTGYRGPPASVYPSFTGGPDGPRLQFETVVPRGWTVVELDPDGLPLRQASTDRITRERPVIGGSPDASAAPGSDRATFVWPATDPDTSAVEIAADWEAPR